MEEAIEKKSFLKKYFGDKAFYKMVLSVAVPIMIQNGITNFVNLLDNIMVGQIGTDQMSGVAIINQLFFIFMLATFGICSGIGIFTAQFHGQNDDEGIRQTFRLKFISCLIITIIFGAIFYIFADQLIGLFLHEGGETGNLDATLQFAKSYLLIILLGFIPYGITQVYSSTLREIEAAVWPMIAGFIAVCCNAVGNVVLIFGAGAIPALGVKGAAIATVISRYIELLIVILATHLNKKFPFAKGIFARFFNIPKDRLIRILKRAIPLFFNEVLWAVSMSLLAQAYSKRGLAVVAAYNISSTISNLFSIVYMALGNAVGIILGKYLGMGDFDTAQDYDRKLITFSVTMGTIVGLIMCAFSPLFPQMYNTTEEVKEIAKNLLIIVSLMMIVYSFQHSCYFTLRSGGRTFITFLYDSAFVSCVSVPAAMILVNFTDLAIIPVFLIISGLDVIKSAIGIIFLKKKIWLNKLI